MDIWPADKPQHITVQFDTIEEKYIFDSFVPDFVCLEYWHNLKDKIVGADDGNQEFPLVRNMSTRTLARTLCNLEMNLEHVAADNSKLELAIALKRQIGGYFLKKYLAERHFY